jgi:Uncharacterised nucleotidyltransferase
MSPQIDRHTLSLILSERTQALDLASFAPADWELLLQKAEEEGVAPLIYWTLCRSGELSACPTAVEGRLRAVYFSVRMNNEALLKELENLTFLFDRAEIPVVALKGICFALTIYPEIGLRPMGDLDLLTPASQVADALRIVKESGYMEIVPEALPGIDSLLSHAVGLQKNAAPFTMLELHHTLVAEKGFMHAVSVDWFWTQTEPFQSISPRWPLNSLLMLSPTAQVLYASAHIMLQHGSHNTNLRWYYDLDRLVRVYAQDIDWDLLLAQAQTFAWGSAVFAALSKTVEFFGTPVPGSVLDELSKHADRNAQTIAALQTAPASRTLEEWQRWKSLTWTGRVRVAVALIAPSPAYMRWRYGLKGSWALPVYYVYRWWEITKDAARTIGLLVRSFFVQANPVGLELDKAPEKSP